MPTFTWNVIGNPAPVSPPVSTDTVATPATLFGNFDQEIDPQSLDYVDTADGAWSETATSRTAVMMQLEIRYGSWPPDPDAGSRIAEMLEGGDPVTPDMLVDEVRRCLQLVVVDGMITDLAVAAGDFDPDSGVAQIEVAYTDVASGFPVELVYSPF